MCNNAYAAGIIDGEGSISIIRKKDYRPNRTHNIHYHLIIQVGMTVREVCEWLLGIFGGRVNSYSPKNGGKQVHIWKIYGTDAQTFITLVKPYLKVKHSKAELALVFPIANHRPAEIDIQEYIYNRIKEVNNETKLE